MIWDLFLLLSIAWVCLRLYQLSHVSRETLEERLGYDIPPTPQLSVAGITSKSVFLYWLNTKDQAYVGTSLSILVNGVNLGDLNAGQSTIEVLRLKPDHCYTIKFVSTNSDDLAAISDAVRVQTLPLTDSIHTRHGLEEDVPAILRPATPSSKLQLLHGQQKESFLAQQVLNQGSSDRRTTPPTQNVHMSTSETSHSSDNEDEGFSDLLQHLTRTLESLKIQREDAERQIDAEETEAKAHHKNLIRERDELRYELKEKEESIMELKRHGNHLDKLNRAAQGKKMTKEKLLQARKQRRQKFRDDANQWGEELVDLEQSIQYLRQEVVALSASKEEDTTLIRQTLVADQTNIKAIEDEIRVKGAHIKDIEQRKDHDSSMKAQQVDRSDSENDSEGTWGAKYNALQLHLQSLWNALQHSKFEEQQVEEHINWWMANRTTIFERVSSNPCTEKPMAARSATTGGVQHLCSYPEAQTSYKDHGSHLALPPPYQLDRGFLQDRSAESNHVGKPRHSFHTADSQFPVDLMMSPAANDLLPSYLLQDFDVAARPSTSGNIERTDKDARTRAARHSVTVSDASTRELKPHVSTNSRADNLFTSPQNSSQISSTFRGDGNYKKVNAADTSVPASDGIDATAQSTGRFANLFSAPFGWQRGKSSAQESPALGTLKQGQSQSFPRHIEQDVLGSSGLRRRRGSHEIWANPVAGLLGRNSASPECATTRVRTMPSRNTRLNVFKSRIEPLDPALIDQEPSSSRPSSTYSYEKPFERPSNEGQNIWGPIGDDSKMLKHEISWSREASRRASLCHNSSTTLSLGSTPLDAQDLSRASSKRGAEQAPIGTRPAAQPVMAPRLNPTAPSFKTLFSRSDARKAAKAERSGGKNADSAKGREPDRLEVDNGDLDDDASSPQPRLSRDAQSIVTAASTTDSRDSLEHSAAGTSSDSPTPKETLMQKITRKSSSSKFNVPWSKERGMFSKRAGEPSTPGDNDEGVKDNKVSDGGITPHTPREEKRAWTSIRRKPRKAQEKESEGEDHE